MKHGFPDGSVVEESTYNSGDTGAMGFLTWLQKFPGEGNGNPLQSSCLKNPMDRGAWWATSHRAAKKLDMTEWLNSSMCRPHMPALYVSQRARWS